MILSNAGAARESSMFEFGDRPGERSSLELSASRARREPLKPAPFTASRQPCSE